MEIVKELQPHRQHAQQELAQMPQPQQTQMLHALPIKLDVLQLELDVLLSLDHVHHIQEQHQPAHNTLEVMVTVQPPQHKHQQRLVLLSNAQMLQQLLPQMPHVKHSHTNVSPLDLDA